MLTVSHPFVPIDFRFCINFLHIFYNRVHTGEVVIRANSTKRDGIINALLSFDKYFQIDPDFKMFGTFDGHKNVLFNVSQNGFVIETIFQFILVVSLKITISENSERHDWTGCVR